MLRLLLNVCKWALVFRCIYFSRGVSPSGKTGARGRRPKGQRLSNPNMPARKRRLVAGTPFWKLSVGGLVLGPPLDRP